MRVLRIALLVFCCSVALRAMAEEPPVAELVRHARYWEEHGRLDKAAEIWTQLVHIDSSHVEALAALCRYHARRDDRHAARQWLERLRAVAPANPSLPGLEHMVALGAKYEARLADARRLNAAGRLPDAVAAYRELFGKAPPDAPLALEFYQTLAGVESGRAEALQGLADLVRRHPQAGEYQLALAKILTYDEPHRRDGIARLAELAAQPPWAVEAVKAWRQALLWLDAKPTDRPLYTRYLQDHPEDKEVAARLEHPPAEIHGPGQGLRAAASLGPAYEALHRDELDRAAEAFQRLLNNPRARAHALAGLSSVRLRQERFCEAQALALESKQRAPGSRTIWQRPLQAAEFWCLIEGARTALQAEARDRAEALLERAIATASEDVGHAQVMLGRLHLDQGRDEAAEAQFRRVLADAHAGAPRLDAVRGLFTALLRRGLQAEADVLEHELLTTHPASGTEQTALEVAILRGRAAAESDEDQALQLLERALHLAPQDRSLRVELVHRRLGHEDLAGARQLADELLAQAPEDPEAITVAALVRHEEGDLAGTLAILDRHRDRLPADKLPATARTLRRQTALELQCAEALRSRRLVARRLTELLHAAGEDAELRAIVATAMSKAGLENEALAVAHQILAGHPSRGARLRIAALLLASGPSEENELQRLLAELEHDPSLTDRERQRLDALARGFAVQRADRSREAGDTRRAFSLLKPFLARSPADRAVIAALARLYTSTGEHRKARAIYRQLLAAHPDDLDAVEGAVLATYQAGAAREAWALAEQALHRHPDAPAAYLISARLAATSGDDARAHQYLSRGLELAEASGAPPDTGDAAQKELLQNAATHFAPEESHDTQSAPGIENALRKELKALEARNSLQIEGHIGFRFRSGEIGMGRLFELRFPVTVGISPHRRGRLSFGVTPVYLTAGTLNLADPAVAERYASAGAFPGAGGTATDIEQGGLALHLHYEFRGIEVGIGSTPLGLPIADVIGTAGWNGRFGPLSIGLRGLREAVTDSVLSYGGQRDPRTGLTWGGVRRAGGQFHVGYDFSRASLSAHVLYAALTGHNVADNHGGQYAAEVRWRVEHQATQELVTGLRLFAMNHARNLRYFTFGQGGYFSPQLFFAAGVPLRWNWRSSRVTLNLGGELGISWYHEDASPFFPTDATLQAARNRRAGDGTVLAGSSFPAVDRTGPYGAILLEARHRVAPRLVLGESFAGQFSTAYSEIFGFISVSGGGL